MSGRRGGDSGLGRTERGLEDRIAVHRAITQLSRTLLATDPDEIESEIQRQLGTAAALAGCDRTQFIYVDRSRTVRFPRAYGWCAEGVADDHSPLDREGHEFAARLLLGGEVMHVPRLSELPEEAASDRRNLESRGVRSVLTIPVRARENLIGFQVFERTREEGAWSEEEIDDLRIVGEIFASAVRRHVTEGALRQSEERFRTIAEQATELVAEFDSEGRYRYVSPSYETLLGYPPAELMGRRAHTLIHPDDMTGARQTFTRSFEHGVESHSIHRLRLADGEWRWFENSGQAYQGADGDTRFVSIGHDITDRIDAQHALERQLELQQTVAGLSRRLLGLRASDLDAGIRQSLEDVAQLNSADRAFLAGFADAEGRPVSYYEWCAPGVGAWARGRRPWTQAALLRGETLHFPSLDDWPPEAADDRRAVEEQGFSSVLSIPVRSGDCTIGVVGFAGSAPRAWTDDEITLLGLVGEILISAVQRKQAERALHESQLQLAQSQKLEAVGRLAGGIAHDFNNLLTVILGLSRPILQEVEQGTELFEDVEEIHAAAERAAALTRQLLTFSRRQPYEPQAVDLNRTLRALDPLLSRILGEDIDLKIELGADLPMVLADPHQFEQIVVNLAANARDAMPTGGRLRIATEARFADDEWARRLGLAGPGQYVVLSTMDSGEGMSEATRQHIFEPFFTTKDTGKGTGLGLSIVYSVIEQAGGGIEVESAPGAGSIFHLWIPATDMVAESALDEPVDSTLDGHELVLLIEDEPSVRRFGRRVLEEAGYRVLEAADGEDGLVKIEQADADVDAVVTDVVMPRMGGDEFAAQLRAARPDLPILFVSGHPGDRRRQLDLDRADLVEKPFTAELLLERLRGLLDRRG